MRSRLAKPRVLPYLAGMSSLRHAPKPKLAGSLPGPRLETLVRAMQPGHRLHLSADAEKAWQELLLCVECAQRTIDIQLYMLVDDARGRQFTAALTAALRRGVAVRLMLDGVGSMELPDTALAQFLQAGGEFRVFGPIWRSVPWRHWKRRNHRKVFIFDGTSAIVTGRNVGDQYYSAPGDADDDKARVWLDIGAWVQGPAVARLLTALHRDWADRLRRTGRLVKLHQSFARVFGTPIARAEARSLSHPHLAQPAGPVSPVLPSGPRVAALLNLGHRRTAHANRAYLQAIRAATQSIWLAHSYFLPERELQRALMAAARRGVRVVVLLPDAAVNDVQAVALASMHGLPPLLRAGIEVYTLRGPMLHAKAGVVDGTWWTIGSANLDPLSRQRNLEANLAGADARDAAQLLQQLEKWRELGHPWTLADHHQQPWWQRVLGWFLWKFRLVL